MATKVYPGVIFREETGFSITFPDVPGAYSQGDTIEECIAMGQEVLNLALETLTDDGKEIPEASPVAAAQDKAREIYDGTIETVQFVTGVIPGRTAKYTITMDEELMKRVDAAAGKYGRSGWLAEAAREKLASAGMVRIQELSNEQLREKCSPEINKTRHAWPDLVPALFEVSNDLNVDIWKAALHIDRNMLVKKPLFSATPEAALVPQVIAKEIQRGWATAAPFDAVLTKRADTPVGKINLKRAKAAASKKKA